MTGVCYAGVSACISLHWGGTGYAIYFYTPSDASKKLKTGSGWSLFSFGASMTLGEPFSSRLDLNKSATTPSCKRRTLRACLQWPFRLQREPTVAGSVNVSIELGIRSDNIPFVQSHHHPAHQSYTSARPRAPTSSASHTPPRQTHQSPSSY
jgi:hypothetical protein